MSNEKFYLTTAIPYVNAAPHIGHTLEFVQTDAIARFHKICGKDVALTTGADENSLKNVQAAEAKGITPAQLCESNAALFRKMADALGLSYTSFIYSSRKDEHWAGVQQLWQLCDKSGDIYKKKYKGLYCIGCEAFYEESDLPEGLCPEHKTRPEMIEEENYFFRLSKYQQKLEQLIESNELKIVPESRKHEMLSFIRSGLQDFSISRSVSRAKGWGVPVPSSQFPVSGSDDARLKTIDYQQDDERISETKTDQIMYVWFDALSVYITGAGYGKDEARFWKYWPADVHVIGKGILRFHAIYWPAMLLSAGLPLPKAILVHGYITVEGQKMSKSLGNIIDPFYLIEKYGVDPLRYCLLSEVSTFDDGNFSERVLVEKNNSELLANLGNLVNRTLVFTKNNFDGKVPKAQPSQEDAAFVASQRERHKKIALFMEQFRIKEALDECMLVSKDANKYFQDNKPWVLVKTDKERAATAINMLIHQVKDLAILVAPFLPNTSTAIFAQLGVEPRGWADLGQFSLSEGHTIDIPSILFKKLELVTATTGTQHPVVPAPRFSDFDLEVGEIIDVQGHPDAEKLLIEKVQLSDRIIQIVSGIAKHYFPEQLMHKKVVILRNLKPAMLRGVQSNGMLLAAENAQGMLEVLSPAKSNIGDKVYLADEKPNPKAEVTIDQFFKVEIKIESGKILAEGRSLVTDSEELKTGLIIDGKVG